MKTTYLLQLIFIVIIVIILFIRFIYTFNEESEPFYTISQNYDRRTYQMPNDPFGLQSASETNPVALFARCAVSPDASSFLAPPSFTIAREGWPVTDENLEDKITILKLERKSSIINVYNIEGFYIEKIIIYISNFNQDYILDNQQSREKPVTVVVIDQETQEVLGEYIDIPGSAGDSSIVDLNMYY